MKLLKSLLSAVILLSLTVPRAMAQGPGTLLYDHFGVELELQPKHGGGKEESFVWPSFVPTKNTETIDWTESDWYGNYDADKNKYKIDNVGNAAGIPNYVDVEIVGTAISQWTLVQDELASGESIIVPVDSITPKTADFMIKATVDSQEQTVELDENNNSIIYF
ncbi:MAG: hypothetical protein PF692_11725 [Kiritimatiellae bacterium]|jgi:hypothetical protein|nr:hypothetical protein [Kiritimatiellia bacterium]